ncbi:MAG: serine/threonine-protein kinase [Holophaga sp.]|nr:serine/threonine-protein kinase [Holophaga sp.]
MGPLLGQGGVGEVREAWDVVLCRTVALKVLRKMDPSSLIRFMHEARLQSRLAHPNICQIFDVDSLESSPRIAMQLVRGPTLADAAGSLALDEIVQILAQVADAVHAAHRLKLIHRDLKPSNILLEPDPDGGWIPYVCDFGLAMEMDEPTMTAPQWVNGTPAYMAPEQVRGERARIGPPTDVFALGGTLYFALHGEPPQGPSAGGFGLTGEHRPVPRDLERIAQKCMDPEPRLRYPTAAALAEDLWRFRNGEPVQARPAGRLELHWRHWRKAWRLAFAATLAAGALGAALLVEQRQLVASGRRRAQWERFYVLEGAAMARDLGLEQALPPHDLRPAYGRIRTRLQELGIRLAGQGPDAQGSGHYALAQGWFLLGDWPGAQRELDQAGALGFQGPEMAALQAQALAARQHEATQEALFTGGAAPAASATQAAARIEALAREGSALGGGPNEYSAALAAYLRKDYARAAERARVAGAAHPWQSDPPVLTALSLVALGREGSAAGDALLAEVRFLEAMSVAHNRLELSPSNEALQHAYLLAALGLAELQLSHQELALAYLDTLQQFSSKALRLNPGNPGLQDDRLRLAFLRIRRKEQLGQDPGADLDAAVQILAGMPGTPPGAGLRADRMLIYWQQAERTLRQGGDPGPALAEALRDPGHTPFLDQDYLGAVLNFKARVEAAQGRDPRPTLDQALASMDPLLGSGAPRSLCDTAAQSWTIRGRWEAAHGLDPRLSQERAHALAERSPFRRPKALAHSLAQSMAKAGP